ncbi:MAG: HDIG domain-containing protein, partial [Clostridiales bacterium]|nr:HDIG domain-containing protein [Clostridiales bacterium]
MNRDKLKAKNGAKKNTKSSTVFARIVIAVITFAVVYLILIGTAIPKQQRIDEGQIAPDTIKAPRDVVDQYNTDIAKEQARDDVSAKYTQDDNITADVSDALDELNTSMLLVREMGVAEKQRKKDLAGDSSLLIPYDKAFLDSVHEELPSTFSNGDIIDLLNVEKEEYLRVFDMAHTLVTGSMESGVKESALNDEITSLNQQIIQPINNFSESGNNIGMSIISAVLKPNFILDPISTEAAREAAEEAVADIIYKQNENIVLSGEKVTAAQIEVLKDLGIIDDGESNYTRYLSLLAIALIVFVIYMFYLAFAHKKVFNSPKLLLTVSAVSILALLFSWGGSTIHFYLIPIYFSAFICSMVIEDKSLAIMTNVILSILVAVMSTRFSEVVALPVLIASLVGGTVAVIMLKSASQRSNIMISGIVSGLSSSAIYVIFALINYQGWMEMLLFAGMGLASGVIASILAVGTLPMWESVFRLITPMKLLELANPNQPLLKKLLNEAPGTYHHSIMVGNMAERAAEAVGANSLIVRTGAYYHDIGKVKRPYFFVENQQGRNNPHDNIKPDLSTRIITSHLTDGIELVKKAKLPQVIIDMVAQHHGDSAVMYFYHKTKVNAPNPDEVDINDFRYDGEPPISKESAILMLADSVEAAVRSIENPSAKSVKEMIDNIIKGR